MAENNQTPQSGDDRDGRDTKPYSADKTQGQQERMDASAPGVMGDWTEEQNLGQAGDESARIKQDEVEEAFKNAGDQGAQNRAH